MKNAQAYDKKKGFGKPAINRDQIIRLLTQPCSYCDERDLIVTLDRINNDRGHDFENVKPACIRCNMLRNNMPFEAWINLVPAIKQTRDIGLFGEWIGHTFHGKNTPKYKMVVGKGNEIIARVPYFPRNEQEN